MITSDWEKYFSGQILSKGYRYYKTGRVNAENDKDELTVYADVQGTEIYDTRVNYSKYPSFGMYCDCPYAMDGHYCKHMAAVLYSMEYDRIDYERIAGARRTGGNSAGAVSGGYSASGNSSGKNAVPGRAGATGSGTKTVAKQNNIIYPFAGTKSGDSIEEYQYFDFAKMTADLQITEKMYKDAVDLLGSDRMAEEAEVRYYAPGSMDYESGVLYAEILVNKSSSELEFERKNKFLRYRYSYYESSPQFSVVLRMNRDRIYELRCTCDACRNKRGLAAIDPYYSYSNIDRKICEHIVALLIMVNQFIDKNHPGDETDYNALRMLNGIRSDASLWADGNSEDTETELKKTVSLVPLLQNDYQGIKASFKIGNDKMYHLKSVSELVNNVENRKVMELGKNQSIDFAKETFKDDLSSKLYDMIQASVNEEEVRYNILHAGTAYGAEKNMLLLLGHNLDVFYDICKGKNIETKKSNGGPSGILIDDSPVKFELDLDPVYSNQKSFSGVRLQGILPSVSRGASYSYYCDEGRLSRISPECTAIIKKLRSANSNKVDMMVGRKYLNKFFRDVLPAIEKVVNVNNRCVNVVERYLLPDATFVFYVDTEDGTVTCRIKSVYGEKENNALDILVLNSVSFALRDMEREEEAVKQARKYFPEVDLEKRVLICDGEDMIFRLLDEGLSELMRIGEVNLSENFKKLKIRRRPRINIGVVVKSDLLELSVESSDISREELLDYLNSYRKKKRFFRLKNGDLMKVEQEDIGEISAMMDALHLSPKEFSKGNMKLPLYRALYLDKMLEQNSGIYAERDKTFKKLVKEFKTVNESDFEAPEELEKVLRNYQTFGFKWLKTVESCHFGGILADDMGLGKTLQVISLLLDAKRRKEAELSVGESNGSVTNTVAMLKAKAGDNGAEMTFIPSEQKNPAGGKRGRKKKNAAEASEVLTVCDGNEILAGKSGYAGKDAHVGDDVPAGNSGSAEKSGTVNNSGNVENGASAGGLGSNTECLALVVSPASLVYNWKAEFERFAPDMKVCTVTGSQTERADIISHASEWDVLVTSYDLLKRDIAEYGDVNFDYEIIDEAQFIKNHTTAAAKSVKVVNSRQRFALTGTPIENRLSELWSIFDYLMPGFLYGYDVFRKEFETPIARNKDENTMEQLKRMVAPFILRRLKKDVLKDIPDKLEEVYYARMSDKQRKVYDGEVVKIKKMLEKESDEAFGKKKMELLAELTRIRQICCDPHLLFEDYDGDSAKKDTCLELIKSALEGEHRVLLFSQFTSMLDILQQELVAENIGYYRIDGSTSKEKRLELVNDFNDGRDNVNVFLISLKAGGTGLNLTGADVVIHFDPWWNVAAQNQATDRAHRIGQTKVVSVYKIIAKDTIEEKILKMQEDKKNLAENILSGETGGLVGMSREEVMALLG